MRLNFWKKEPVISVESVNDNVNFTNEERFETSETTMFQEQEEIDSEIVANNTYNRISEWVVSVGIVLMPLFFLPFTTGPLEINKQLLLILFSGLALVMWLVGVVSSGYLKWRYNNFIKPVGAIVLATLLATIFSFTKFKSLYGLPNSLSDSFVSIVALAVMYFLIVNTYDDKGKKIQILLAVSVSVAFVYGVLQLLGVYILRLPFTTSRIFNTIGSPNALGVLAAVSLPFLHKLNYNLPLVKNHWSKVATVLAVVILVILNWWVLWTIAIVGMFALVALESMNSKTFKIAQFIVPLMIIVLGVFLMVVKSELSFIKKNLPAEVSPSFNLSSKISGSVLKERFIYGYGPENFSLAFDKHGSTVLSSTSLAGIRFYDSTSEFFNFLVHGGMILVLAILFFVAFVAWNIIRAQIKDTNDSSHTGVMATMMALIVALFLYPFNIGLMFFLFAMLGLVALVLWGDDKYYFSIEKSPFFSLISSLGFIGGLVLVLITSYFTLLMYFADIKYAQALKETDYQKGADMVTKAISWNNHNSDYYRTLSQIALNLLSVEIKKPKTDPNRGARMQNYVSSSVNFAKKATEIDPREALNWTNLGTIYRNLLTLVDGVDKLSEEAYLKAIELRPGDASYYNQIGSLYLTEGDLLAQIALSGSANSARAREGAMAAYVTAEDYLKKSINISNNFGLAIYNLGMVYEREGKLSEAIKQLEKIAPFNSNQPGLMFELGLLYYRAGRKDDAVNQLQRAVLLVPDYANARWYLALIYEEKGDADGAIEQLEKILEVDVNKGNVQVTEKLNAIKSGKKIVPPPKVLDQKPL